MHRFAICKQLGFGALLLMGASSGCLAASAATLSGVVRDAGGVGQMGATVQVLSAGAVSVATATTDMYGRYRFANLLPGSYQVRASAALFIPAVRRNLRLSTGMLATVNLTLNMLGSPVAWLPAQRRRAEEPGDDWAWTLRSVANRPLLRLLGDGTAAGQADAAEKRTSAATHGRIAALGGIRSFGHSGLRSVAVAERSRAGGSVVLLRSAAGAQAGGAPAFEAEGGYQTPAGLAGQSRVVAGVASHPEITVGGRSGLQVMRLVSARRMRLGDAIDVEAGGTVYAIRSGDTVLATRPFVRVTAHPAAAWAMRYSLATSRDVQEFADLDSLGSELPVTAVNAGRMQMEDGRHQELAVARRFGQAQVEAAVYRDRMDRVAVAGIGDATGYKGAMVDTATGTFRVLVAGYDATGLRVAVSMPIAGPLLGVVSYDRGAALTAPMRAEDASAMTAALDGRLQRTGTKLRMAYRWQTAGLVTAVNSYDAADGGYLGFYVRQSLPGGLAATVNVTNLLAQGYQPVLLADGRTVFFAESPRTLMAGLSFSF